SRPTTLLRPTEGVATNCRTRFGTGARTLPAIAAPYQSTTVRTAACRAASGSPSFRASTALAARIDATVSSDPVIVSVLPSELRGVLRRVDARLDHQRSRRRLDAGERLAEL